MDEPPPEMPMPDDPIAAARPMSRVDRLVGALVSWRWLWLAVAAVATLAAYGPSRRLAFDRSIENMFAPNDPVLGPFRQLKRTFGGDEIALAAYIDRELLTPSGLDRLDRLSAELASVPGVRETFSLATVKRFLLPPLDTIYRDRVLDISEGYTVGADRKTAGIVCVLMPEHETPVPRAETIDELRRSIEAHDPSAVLTGEPVMLVDGFRFLEADGQLLGATSTALLMLTIVFCFRSLRWVIAPMAVVGATLLWTEAALVESHLRLSLVSSMLWAIITVIGVATVIHLVIGFRQFRADGVSPVVALRLAGQQLAVPIFWACLTDAAGFASLMVSQVGPVHDFGLMMLVGSLLTLVAIGLIVPGVSLAGRFDADPRRAWGEGRLDAGLERLVDRIERHPRGLAAAVAAVSLVCSLGMFNLEVETDFTKNFRADSPIVRAYDFVEARLGGAGVWDVVVPVPDTGVAEFLKRVTRLEERLRSEVVISSESETGPVTQPGLTKVLSAVDALDLAPLGRVQAAWRLEATLERLDEIVPMVKAMHGHDPLSGDRFFLRIMLRARERQPSHQKKQLVEQVRRISREEFPEAEVTGFFVLLTKIIESVTRDQWLTFGVASAAIGVMMLVAFRSLSLALAALVPNALPVFVVTGLMGWLRLRINMGAAMIASVSMGLAVDSSIHYITAFRRHRASGLSTGEALHAVHQSVGRAMVFSTLALIVGFAALVLSRFVPTIYFGALVGLTMFGGLLGNLVVLPLLLKLVAELTERRPARNEIRENSDRDS